MIENNPMRALCIFFPTAFSVLARECQSQTVVFRSNGKQSSRIGENKCGTASGVAAAPSGPNHTSASGSDGNSAISKTGTGQALRSLFQVSAAKLLQFSSAFKNIASSNFAAL
jgi:hypothetical protein